MRETAIRQIEILAERTHIIFEIAVSHAPEVLPHVSWASPPTQTQFPFTALLASSDLGTELLLANPRISIALSTHPQLGTHRRIQSNSASSGVNA
jgi:hypothetical protein